MAKLIERCPNCGACPTCGAAPKPIPVIDNPLGPVVWKTPTDTPVPTPTLPTYTPERSVQNRMYGHNA